MSKLLLQNARLSFPSLFRKTGMKNETDPSKFAYSCTLILDKVEDAAQIEKIKADLKECGEAFFGVGKIPKKFKCCLKDGDEEDGEELIGKMFLRTSSKNQRPTVVKRDGTPIVEEDDIVYAGCYVHATVSFWAYKNDFGPGISANIRAVMFSKDGDAFSGSKVDMDSEFEGLAAEETTEEDSTGGFLD